MRDCKQGKEGKAELGREAEGRARLFCVIHFCKMAAAACALKNLVFRFLKKPPPSDHELVTKRFQEEEEEVVEEEEANQLEFFTS